MKKVFVAAFLGVLGLFSVNESFASSGNSNEQAHKSIKEVLAGITEETVGLNGTELETLQKEIQAKLKIKDDGTEQWKKKLIGEMLSDENRTFNVFKQIKMARQSKGADLKYNVGTMVEIIENMLSGGKEYKGIEAKDLELTGTRKRDRLFAACQYAVAKLIGRKESSKDKKLESFEKILTDFSDDGLGAATKIIIKLGEQDYSKLMSYVKDETNGLNKDVKTLFGVVEGMKFDENTISRRKTKQERQIIRKIKTALQNLLAALGTNLCGMMLNMSGKNAARLLATVNYLHALQTKTGDDSSAYLGEGMDVVTSTTLLDFYIQYGLGEYGRVSEWDDGLVKDLNEQLRMALTDENIREDLKDIYKTRGGTDSDNIEDYLITQEDFENCMNWARKEGLKK